MLYIVHCTLYTVHRTLYHTLHAVHCISYTVHCTQKIYYTLAVYTLHNVYIIIVIVQLYTINCILQGRRRTSESEGAKECSSRV